MPCGERQNQKHRDGANSTDGGQRTTVSNIILETEKEKNYKKNYKQIYKRRMSSIPDMKTPLCRMSEIETTSASNWDSNKGQRSRKALGKGHFHLILWTFTLKPISGA